MEREIIALMRKHGFYTAAAYAHEWLPFVQPSTVLKWWYDFDRRH